MAGVTEANYKSNDEGSEVQIQQVPAIGGAAYRSAEGMPPTVSVVASAHLGDAMRAEGVAYNSDQSIGTDVTTDAYPKGTDVGEAHNPLR